MWTTENRHRYDRSKLRCPRDVTDPEWALIKTLIPPAKRGGNTRAVDIRKVVNGMLSVLSTGCQRRAVPKDLPARSTVNRYLGRWAYDHTIDQFHHALHVKCREQVERNADPAVAIIDGHSLYCKP